MKFETGVIYTIFIGISLLRHAVMVDRSQHRVPDAKKEAEMMRRLMPPLNERLMREKQRRDGRHRRPDFPIG